MFLCSFTVLVSLSLLFLTIRTHKQIIVLFIYSVLPISRCHFSPNNSRRTPIARSLGRDMDVILEFEVLPKFYIRNGCVGWNIVLYWTAIYRKSIVLCSFVVKWYTHECLTKCKYIRSSLRTRHWAHQPFIEHFRNAITCELWCVHNILIRVTPSDAFYDQLMRQHAPPGGFGGSGTLVP